MVAQYLLCQKEHDLTHPSSMQWFPPLLFHYLSPIFKDSLHCMIYKNFLWAFHIDDSVMYRLQQTQLF